MKLGSPHSAEVLYPAQNKFGTSTAASLKNYGLSWYDLNIMARLRGVEGIEPTPDAAFFSNVDVSTKIGGVPLKIPIATGAFGSTKVGKEFWDGLAAGAALSGAIIIVGENVCGVDPESKYTKGKVTYSKELESRVKKFREFWDWKYGDIVVQTNVEDQRGGVDLYAISKLEVNVIERKWGQGAKAIGGEIRVTNLKDALTLKKRGYIVIPDPEDKKVQEAFKAGIFKSFERHSRVGMPAQRDFVEDVEWLREQGAKKVTMKTGAYRTEDLAWTMKVASEAKVDVITIDGAGGGTGMSPAPMMNEMGIPTVWLEAQVLKCAQLLKKKGRHVPDISMAGGFINETQIFKSIAMSNFGKGPFVKAITIARSPLTAVMKVSYYEELAAANKLPHEFADQYGTDPSKFFVTAPELKKRLGAKYGKLPLSGMGLYTYLSDRVKVGLQQLMAGARKWKLDLIDRDDLVSLNKKAAKVTGIPTIEDTGSKVIDQILG